jgi:hypothetical protein
MELLFEYKSLKRICCNKLLNHCNLNNIEDNPKKLLKSVCFNKSPISKYDKILFLLLFCGFLYRCLFIYKNISFLTDFWLFEDTFYSLNIAKNISHGLGWTFDGVIHTNGFQPLYVFMMVPIYWIFKSNLIAPIYIALTILAVFNVLTGYLLYKISNHITKNEVISIIVTCVWLFNPAIARNGTNGLETGLSTFFFALCIYYYLLHIRTSEINRKSNYEYMYFGLLLGIAYLARVDNIFVILLVVFDQLLIYFGKVKIFNIKQFNKYLISASTFLIIPLIYSAYNFLKFSYALPLSGKVLENHPLSIKDFAFDFSNAIYNCINILIGSMVNSGGVRWGSDCLFINANSILPIIFLTILSLIVLCMTYATFKKNRASAYQITSFLIYSVFLISVYQYNYSNFIFERYFYPVIFSTLIIIALILNVFFSEKKHTMLLIVLIFSITLLISNVSAFEKIDSSNYHHAGWYEGTEWMNRNLSGKEIVGASQCGNTGYFYKGRAINLDGVVNYGAYEAFMNKQLLDYFTVNNISCLADEENWVFAALERFNNPDEENIIKSRMKLRYKTNDFAYSIYEINNSVTYKQITDISSDSISKVGNWQYKKGVTFINDDIYMSWNNKDYIELTTNKSINVRFFRHPWSGKVNIYLGGKQYKTVDLYYPVGDPTFDVSVPVKKLTVVKLEVAGEKNKKSSGYEVWVDAIFS